MKKHPILFSILIIVLIVAVMSGAVLTLVYFTGGRTGTIQFGEHIALIEIQGTLKDGDYVTNLLHRYARQTNVKAIIISINSPGGGVAPSQEIYREIKRVREKKPVVAFMGSVAASGGYYVASAASKIMASPGTLTGSIGVIMEFANLEELMKKIGVGATVIKSGAFKDIGSPTRPMTDEERKFLKALVDDVNNQFINDVAKGRNLDVEKVRAIADGRIFTGKQAKELGLIDDLGNFRDAVDLTKKLANIKGEVKLLKPAETLPSIWEYIVRGATHAVLDELDMRAMSLRAVP